MATIYDTISHFFSANEDKEFSRKNIYLKFKQYNRTSLHTTITHLARDKKIIPVVPRKWKWNK